MAEPTETSFGKASTKGHGVGSRERRLMALPYWDEIEVRLRHRWTPDRVLEWYRRTYPDEPAPSRMSLYRYLKSQGASWYVPELVIKQTATTSVSRILVIEKQANLIRTQMLRLNSALAFEAKQESSMSSEVRANLELLNRLLESHRKAQQEAG